MVKHYTPNVEAARYQQQIVDQNVKRRSGGQEERLEKGTTLLRVLPPWSELGAVSRLVSKWWKREMQWNTIKEGALPVISEMWPDIADPIMNALDRISQITDVSKLYPRAPKYLINALKASLTPPGVGAQAIQFPDWMTPRVVEVGKTVNDWIHEQILDPNVGNITHASEGYWIGVKRTGEQLSTEYACSVYFKIPQRIVEDEAQLQAIVAQMHNLDEFIARPDGDMIHKQQSVAEELLRRYNVAAGGMVAAGPISAPVGGYPPQTGYAPAAAPPQTGYAPPAAPPPAGYAPPAAPAVGAPPGVPSLGAVASPVAPGVAAPPPGASAAAPAVPGAPVAPPPVGAAPVNPAAPVAPPPGLVAPPAAVPPGGPQPPFPGAAAGTSPVAPPVHPPEHGYVPPASAASVPGAGTPAATTPSTGTLECFSGNGLDKHYLNEAKCQICARQIECQQIDMKRSAPAGAQEASTESPEMAATQPAPGPTLPPAAPPVPNTMPPATAAPFPSEVVQAPPPVAAEAPPPAVAPTAVVPAGSPPCLYNLKKGGGPAEGLQCEDCLYKIACEEG